LLVNAVLWTVKFNFPELDSSDFVQRQVLRVLKLIPTIQKFATFSLSLKYLTENMVHDIVSLVIDMLG